VVQFGGGDYWKRVARENAVASFYKGYIVALGSQGDNIKTILITGGAGFIGVNAARYFCARGWAVTLLDNLSRPGANENLDWVRRMAQVSFEHADIRDRELMERIVGELKPNTVLHLAAQVAVTTSVANPREDFEINALGTVNLLEAIRQKCPESFFINASTNKVYGRMEDLEVIESNGRYGYRDVSGIAEERSLDFHSPYGCSKGVADQYTIDYARIYGLGTVSFRQSCIYGRRQFGVEDQGWIAWFIIAALLGRPITIYGNGKQVRDALHVDDLVHAYELAFEHRDRVSGEAFNIGGGPDNTLSLLELVEYLEEELAIKIPIAWGDWRTGDQPVFICAIDKIANLLGWKPKISVRKGVSGLVAWIRDNKHLFDVLHGNHSDFVALSKDDLSS
jgi:CDP-paratose 2-epimerase